MSYWIWHWGEWENYHTRELHLRREDDGVEYPAFWKLTAPHVTVKFKKKFSGAGKIRVISTGMGYFRVDNKVRHPFGEEITVGEGAHTIDAIVSSRDGLPAIYVESDVCPSDGSWFANNAATDFSPVGFLECYDKPEDDPTVFPFAYERILPVSCEAVEGGRLWDFGDEYFGCINLSGGVGRLGVFYGESREEALDTDYTIVFEHVEGGREHRLRGRAFRYIYVKGADDSVTVTADYEYVKYDRAGSFSCESELINRIYRVSEHTFHLNCREGFLDGIKRDRWVWAGDAYQSARINAYLYADPDISERTAIGLIGHSPIEQHLNSILDYSFLWLIGLGEHHMTYGRREFIDRILPMARELLQFCETRLREDGFVVGRQGDYRHKTGDWTFIDWSPDLDKTGAVCAEQMLLCAAYATMARLTGETSYAEKSEALKTRINEYYWRAERGAFIDSFESGRENVTRHANIFAIMYGIATPEQCKIILERVLKNDDVPKITTPYFRGYELDALAMLGELEEVERVIAEYWGAMIKLGATTVWEQFDPNNKGVEHYAMYGYRYGKSLCHAWGATSIYLFGRYYLGVYPTEPGYASFRVEPNPGGLGSFEGEVLIPGGSVSVSLRDGKLRVLSDCPGGTLAWGGCEYAIVPGEPIEI